MSYLLTILLAPILTFAAQKIEVQGHRGARAIVPENTLAAMDYALEVGVDTLELDLGVTKDNVLVLSHDPLLSTDLCVDRTGKPVTKEIPIHSLTLKELKTYNCASIKNARFPKQIPDKTQTIATLKEVFELVKNSKHLSAKKVEFNIETKLVPGIPQLSIDPRSFAKNIIDLATKYEVLDRVTIQSFDHRSLKEAKKLNPKVKVAALFEGTYPSDLLSTLKAIPADVFSPNQFWFTKADVDTLRSAGVRTIPWTANSVREWDALIAKGVDGIITDDPKALIDYLKSKKLR